MRSKSFRYIYENEKGKYIFSRVKFRQAIREYRELKAESGEKTSLSELYEMISEKASVSEDAVKNWYNGNNGPSDISLIKIVADVLNVNFMELLDLDRVSTGVSNKTMVVKDVISTNEKDIIKNILNDYIEIINDFGPSAAYEFIPFTKDDGMTYYDKWICKLNTKLMQNRWSVSEESFKKLFSLFCEVKFFVTRMNRVHRWIQIEPMFQYICDAKEYDEDPSTDWDSYIHRELDDGDRKIVEERVAEVYQDDFCLETIVYTYGFIIGKWFLNILIHDFPELFV